ncbi:hypothetical protein B0T20DRAFT_353257 [Sordaria brevicollis]|uniref:Uncharacterized protein n=1 Tax=Sordaria brevicollis TaxID=83679 RepID=A0AAE0PEL1_SORBR|nr:hypothetical protein B0T20DRAFT_353257 [Sordaria brevicollis]
MSSSNEPPDISGNGAGDNQSSIVLASEIQPGTGTGTSTSTGQSPAPAAAASKPKIFKIPIEIRRMIYRFAWTIDPKPYRLRKTYQLRYDYLAKQMAILTKMGEVSRQMRDEAYGDFFRSAQAYMRWNTQQQGYSPQNLEAMRVLQHCVLMENHLQHVIYHWPENAEHRGSMFRWLETLSQLRTLKIVFSGAPGVGVNERHKAEHYLPRLFRRLVQSLETRNANFPESKKPWVTFYVEYEKLVALWNQLDWFTELVREISRGTDPKPPSTIIENHLGCLDPLWPRQARL